MRDEFVNWKPYLIARLERVPSVFLVGALWLTAAPLVNFSVVEFQYPDRVMQQFGYQQKISEIRCYDKKLHELSGTGRVPNFDWAGFHRVHVANWNTMQYQMTPNMM